MDETGNEWKAKLWDSSSPRRPRWSKIEEFQMTEKVSKRFQIEHILSSILFYSLSLSFILSVDRFDLVTLFLFWNEQEIN